MIAIIAIFAALILAVDLIIRYRHEQRSIENMRAIDRERQSR